MLLKFGADEYNCGKNRTEQWLQRYLGKKFIDGYFRMGWNIQVSVLKVTT